jgi:glucose-6-phosphate isomerase
MSSSIFTYDDANMRRERVGRHGTGAREWSDILPALARAKESVLRQSAEGEQGFLKLPNDAKVVRLCESLARETRKNFSDLIVLGIGGSDLGARAIHEALGGARKKGVRLHFAGSSTDPNQLLGILETVDFKKTAVNVVSKSGGTIETISAFLILRDRLKRSVGKRFAEHVIATTDPREGVLRELAEKEGYASIPIPANVGGRFSVLSGCGLYPAAVMGVDLQKMLGGAKQIARDFKMESASRNAACRYAGLHVIGMRKRNQRIHVIMPYHSKMREFARWVRQLVAESLGKETDHKGRIVHEGVTPVAAIGPEDQHSQLQLYGDGPFDKLVTFIGVERFRRDLQIPSAPGLPETMAMLSGCRLSQLIEIERRATAESLRRTGRPNGTFLVHELDEAALGGLFMSFEISVAIMAEVLGVNAYDQPGVELSKRIMRDALR